MFTLAGEIWLTIKLDYSLLLATRRFIKKVNKGKDVLLKQLVMAKDKDK
jgi:hypothetical protein